MSEGEAVAVRRVCRRLLSAPVGRASVSAGASGVSGRTVSLTAAPAANGSTVSGGKSSGMGGGGGVRRIFLAMAAFTTKFQRDSITHKDTKCRKRKKACRETDRLFLEKRKLSCSYHRQSAVGYGTSSSYRHPHSTVHSDAVCHCPKRPYWFRIPESGRRRTESGNP